MFTPKFGYIKNDKITESFQARLKYPTADYADVEIRGSGKGKKMYGHEIVASVYGKFFAYNQTSVGDCVAQSCAGALTLARAFDIFAGEPADFEAPNSVEDIYAGARVLIGKHGSGGDGTLPIYAMRYLKEYGYLVMKNYGNYDLSSYDSDRAKSWGNKGAPKELVEIAKETPIGEYTQVNTYEQACDMLYNGYPVTIASNFAFLNKRDDDGFSKIDPSNEWPHQMYLLSFDDEYKRPGVLVMNSWPVQWITGPKRNQPDGSFWVSPEEINKVFKEKDSWAISNLTYKLKPISPIFI